MTIDWKYRILAVNPCKQGSVYTEEDGMFFKAGDAAIPDMLRAYIQICLHLGAGEEHIEAISRLLDRVEQYQKQNGSKVPDTDTDCEIDRCVRGIGVG